MHVLGANMMRQYVKNLSALIDEVVQKEKEEEKTDVNIGMANIF